MSDIPERIFVCRDGDGEPEYDWSEHRCDKDDIEYARVVTSQPWGVSACGHDERFVEWEDHSRPITCLKCECGKLQLQIDTWEYTVDKSQAEIERLQKRLAWADTLILEARTLLRQIQGENQ